MHDLADQYILPLPEQGTRACFASELELLPDYWDEVLANDEQNQRLGAVLRRQLEFVRMVGYCDTPITIELRLIRRVLPRPTIRLVYLVSIHDLVHAPAVWQLFHASFPNDLDLRLKLVPKLDVPGLLRPLGDVPLDYFEWKPIPSRLKLPDRDTAFVRPPHHRVDNRLSVLRLLAQQSTDVVLSYFVQPVITTGSQASGQSILTPYWEELLKTIEAVQALLNSPIGLQSIVDRFVEPLESDLDKGLQDLIGNDPAGQWVAKGMAQMVREQLVVPADTLSNARTTGLRYLKATAYYRWRVQAAIPLGLDISVENRLSHELRLAVAADLGLDDAQVVTTHYECLPCATDEGERALTTISLTTEQETQSVVDPGMVIDEVGAAALIGIPILPRGGIPGLRSYPANPFATWQVSSAVAGASIELGAFIDSRVAMLQADGQAFTVALDDLTRHTLITGATGAGKTTTCKRILAEVHQRGIPFLVIEPVKDEYAGLTFSPQFVYAAAFAYPSVYRIGAPSTGLWFNPFYIRRGVSLDTHLSYLQSCFLAAFPMPGIFGMVLTEVLREAYRAKARAVIQKALQRGQQPPHYGFCLTQLAGPAAVGVEVTIDGRRPVPADLDDAAFPMLSELPAIAKSVIDRLDYAKGEFQSNLRAAINFRLEFLVGGSVGRLLSPAPGIPSFERSLPNLLARPLIFQLADLGDKSEKALLMAFILTALYEYYGSAAPSSQLRHVTLIEEAHVLLENVPRAQSDDSANVRGKAIELFADMLAEIRSRGEGLIIAEQLPSKLIPEVIKNTNLKIMHRLTARDDRELLGAAMNLSDRQSRFATTLERGQAIVFREGLSEPALVAVKSLLAEAPGRRAIEQMLQARPLDQHGHHMLSGPLSQSLQVCRKANFDPTSLHDLFKVVRAELRAMNVDQPGPWTVVYYLDLMLKPFPHLGVPVINQAMELIF